MRQSPEACVGVIGCGPAGLTAAMYLARAAVPTVAFKTVLNASQITYTNELENYPGVQHVSGADFVARLEAQAAEAGAEIVEAQVTVVVRETDVFIVHTAEGDAFEARAVMVATGARRRPLGIPGEERLRGRGVSYCGTCDGPLFRGKTVIVVGGGDTAAEDGFLLSKLAAKVYLVHRRNRMRAQAAFAERFLAQPNVEAVWNSLPIEVVGQKSVTGLRVRNLQDNAEHVIKADGIFVLVGGVPNTEMVKGLAPMDENGYIVTDEEMRTSVAGLFAAGDCRRKSFRQVVTACGDGALAAFSAQRYVENLQGCAYPGR